MVLEISVHVGTNDINLVFVAGVGGVDCSTPATSHRNRVELGIVKTTQVLLFNAVAFASGLVRIHGLESSGQEYLEESM